MAYFESKMHQVLFRLGIGPIPLGRSPDTLPKFQGPTSKGRGWEGGRGMREGKGDKKGGGRKKEGRACPPDKNCSCACDTVSCNGELFCNPGQSQTVVHISRFIIPTRDVRRGKVIRVSEQVPLSSQQHPVTLTFDHVKITDTLCANLCKTSTSKC